MSSPSLPAPSFADIVPSSIGVAAPLDEGDAPRANPSVPPPSKAHDPYIGTTIDGRYRVEAVLGEGGMGVVYAGRHKVINKRVAIKVLRGEMSRDREMTERFLQEARAASSIGHPHIVDVSDFGVMPDGSAFFVMEFLEGRSLSGLMGEVKPVPVKRLAHVARQVADALFAAHSQGIVHRDLKPDNVFLIDRGIEKDFVKILDFGIAKVASSSTQKLTRAGTVFGTPHYMSPEQAAGAPVDHRTDIYALGVIMYEMASGRVPFDADNYMGILTQHMYKAPVPIRVLVPPPSSDLPPGLEAIILKALSKKAEQRYQEMTELIEDLNRLDRGEMPLAVSEMMARSGAFNVPADYFSQPVVSGVAQATPSMPRKRWGLYAGLAGIGAAVALTVGIMAHGQNSEAQLPAGSASAPVVATAPTAAPTPTQTAAPAPAGPEIKIVTTPSDAQVFRDGKSLGEAPIDLIVPTGETIQLEIRAADHTTRTITVDGKLARVDVKLDREKAVGKPGVGGPSKAGGGAAPPPTNKPVRPSGGGDVADPWGGKH